MARFIGIDYGRKRTGIAVTDPLGLISSPLKTLMSYEVLSFLQNYTAREHIAGIIIGLPSDLQGRYGEMTLLVKGFTRLLNRYFPKTPLYHYDERFTSVLAKKSLLEAGTKKKQRRKKDLLDAISASLILSSFLELHGRGKSQSITHPTAQSLSRDPLYRSYVSCRSL